MQQQLLCAGLGKWSRIELFFNVNTNESGPDSQCCVLRLTALVTFQQILGLICVCLSQVRRFSEAFFYTEHQKPAVLMFQEGL